TEQIERGGPVTVTDPQIRRFFMTIPEACRLVMEAATIATGTQIFVFDMGTPIKIDDLARRMISLAGFTPDKDIAIEYTGLRPGEKLYEEVLATKENTIPTDHDRIFVAKVREYEYDNACATSDELYSLAAQVEIPEMVKLMKRTVPEFISKHSVFEIYDKKD
ncbi:MAG: polysaccharide biosynthesis protein, partial [Muribaculaceae bacterium]|nr:polysaccharide biosynthesis protein [Muribaculaceae bacterium]